MKRLVQVLARARARWLMIAILRAIVVAVCVASVLTIVAFSARWFFGIGASLSLILLGFGAGIVLPLARDLTRLPTLVQLASQADRRLDLHDRLATALELARRPVADLSIVERAAVEDANPYASNLSVGQIVPFRLPPLGWAALLLLGTAAAASLLIPATRNQIAPSEEAKPLSDVSRNTVQRVTDVLKRDAEAQSDPYLGAVAREFQEFAERLEGEDRDVLTASEVAELDRLLDHLERATRSRQDAAGRRLNDLAERGLHSREATHESQASLPDSDEPPAYQPDRADEAPDVLSVRQGQESSSSFEETLQELERATANAEGQASERLAVLARGEENEGGYDDAYDAPAEPDEPSAQVQEGEAGGEPVGHAQEADANRGDAAGEGEGPQNGRAREEDLLASMDGEVERVRLPDAQPDPEGTHYEVRGVPGANVEQANAIVDVRRLAAHRTDEGSMTSQGVDWGYHDVVQRYFLPGPITTAQENSPAR